MKPVSQDERDGAAIYGKAMLAVYDVYVLQFSNAFVWRCPRSRLLEHYVRHLSGNHLEIGPGTGWYLRHATFPIERPSVTLFDLNPTPMLVTARRLAERNIHVQRHIGSVLQPLALSRFDSVAANFVFHCVPGTWAEKGKAFEHIADAVAEHGVFFGSTILDLPATQNWAARGLSALYNRRLRVFHNDGDDLDGLKHALKAAFDDVTIDVVGTVAVFAARKPRRRASQPA